ncbi:hypothetical protein I302_105684 [Kwoniella bestiolae CBS 10118]|uniref:Uncharacterized protein n=1 Tax=Kwoniella bestiolae CBS 10118 TaxID=1296100 RepID=A0A1B9G1U8_9TREE|nr:hypothetical protein I302_04803 [Kwoniella bestiolae CBS 10118]OCF24993.1 hypothetical protein I302_04803 [Kwoniella bestiolae CBS 10118]
MRASRYILNPFRPSSPNAEDLNVSSKKDVDQTPNRKDQQACSHIQAEHTHASGIALLHLHLGDMAQVLGITREEMLSRRRMFVLGDRDKPPNPTPIVQASMPVPTFPTGGTSHSKRPNDDQTFWIRTNPFSPAHQATSSSQCNTCIPHKGRAEIQDFRDKAGPSTQDSPSSGRWTNLSFR